jgi:hypothetical protein
LQKEISNKVDDLDITISEMLDNENKKGLIYRDIFRYLTREFEKDISKTEEGIKKKYDFNFKTRPLVNWLLDNNIQFQTKFKDKGVAKSYNAHTISPYVINRVNRLTELKLIAKGKNKVTSERNKSETDIYFLTRLGYLIALTLILKSEDKTSLTYSKVLGELLIKWSSYVPNVYDVDGNPHYRFLKELLSKCVDEYPEIILTYLDIIYKHATSSSTWSIEYSNLRSALNYDIYKKMLIDNDFRSLYYLILNRPKKWIRLDLSKHDSFFFKDLERIINFQFKNDVEKTIEEKCFKHIRDAAIGYRNDLPNQTWLDFRIKKRWDLKRIELSSDIDCIVMLVQCSNCGRIFDYVFKIKEDSLKNKSCKACNNGLLKPFEFLELDIHRNQ